MSKIYPEEIKQKALDLRKQGYVYSEIQKAIAYSVPKNTFTGWFKNVILSENAKQRITNKIKELGAPGRAIAWQNIRKKRADLLKNIYNKIDSEIIIIDKFAAKLCLAMLYLAEGAKSDETVRFSNSDPKIIELFLKLLRQAFDIDEKKLRGKVQCRADQNAKNLEIFWSNLSGIPVNQFNKSWKDKRTIGKPTKRANYKGVFVIYYFSNRVFLELKFVSDIIYIRSLNKGL